jgi:hypothetical protein
MYDDLVGLYQSGNVGQKLILRNQLQAIEMSSLNTLVSYLLRITHIHDHLAFIGETIDDTELVNVALIGLPRSWEPFVHERIFHIFTYYVSIASRTRFS